MLPREGRQATDWEKIFAIHTIQAKGLFSEYMKFSKGNQKKQNKTKIWAKDMMDTLPKKIW